MILGVKFETSFDLIPEIELRTELDLRFSGPFPLAPSNLGGEVDSREYRRQNNRFGQGVSDFLLEEMSALNYSDLRGGTLLHLGTGEGHDLGYIPKAMENYLNIMLVDASKVVCRRTKMRLRRMLSKEKLRLDRFNQPEVVFADAEKLILGGEFSPGLISLVLASRIFQLMSLDKVQRTLLGLGPVLSHNGRIVLVHPFPEDNQDIKWGHTTPHQLAEILKPLEDGARMAVTVVREKKLVYYGQVYTGIVLAGVL
ncbi:MAG: hypothetical protein WDN47_03400 [Candidatus Doudnabacteria bacterium]